jgi:hypothetical protein
MDPTNKSSQFGAVTPPALATTSDVFAVDILNKIFS